jgi:hypothetical protein
MLYFMLTCFTAGAGSAERSKACQNEVKHVGSPERRRPGNPAPHADMLYFMLTDMLPAPHADKLYCRCRHATGALADRLY